ncbi:hypothetical protein ACB094_10G125000 [Castanea mollissima]
MRECKSNKCWNTRRTAGLRCFPAENEKISSGPTCFCLPADAPNVMEKKGGTGYQGYEGLFLGDESSSPSHIADGFDFTSYFPSRWYSYGPPSPDLLGMSPIRLSMPPLLKSLGFPRLWKSSLS